MYLIIAVMIFANGLVNFDQYQYYPEGDELPVLENNFYDDSRPEDAYVEKVSIPSKYVSGDFLSLFLRYNPDENGRIRSNCPDFEPLKNDGFNSSLKAVMTDDGLSINPQSFSKEDKMMLVSCLEEFYEIAVNDSVYTEQSFYFYEHPKKSQKGILTVLPTKGFQYGENLIRVRKLFIQDSVAEVTDFATLPVWYSGE